MISVVVKSRRSPNNFIPGEGEVKEYVYFKERIKGSDKDVLSGIADSIKSLLETGEFKDLTGIAVENPSVESASKYFPSIQGNEGKISGNDGEVLEREGEQVSGEERREVSRKAWEETAFRRERLAREIEDVNKRLAEKPWGGEEWTRRQW